MAKKNAKQQAAANCEAAKQNKLLPFQNVPQDDTSIVTDPSYMEHDSETNDSRPKATSQSLQAVSTTRHYTGISATAGGTWMYTVHTLEFLPVSRDPHISACESRTWLNPTQKGN
ncbi:hypothetical protein DFH08DRAFT_808279 [Mycena albidolilacea]|uniref:Uncharacterized protein n=1 Tax=Mycena albidolilacea TaxID=1033008 RepID=A0AAD7A301_9AGAR|nr:hypothetical protein DFH08DRAFT_808279 [Mycena albidolilacea]